MFIILTVLNQKGIPLCAAGTGMEICQDLFALLLALGGIGYGGEILTWLV